MSAIVAHPHLYGPAARCKPKMDDPEKIELGFVPLLLAGEVIEDDRSDQIRDGRARIPLCSHACREGMRHNDRRMYREI